MGGRASTKTQASAAERTNAPHFRNTVNGSTYLDENKGDRQLASSEARKTTHTGMQQRCEADRPKRRPTHRLVQRSPAITTCVAASHHLPPPPPKESRRAASVEARQIHPENYVPRPTTLQRRPPATPHERHHHARSPGKNLSTRSLRCSCQARSRFTSRRCTVMLCRVARRMASNCLTALLFFGGIQEGIRRQAVTGTMEE